LSWNHKIVFWIEKQLGIKVKTIRRNLGIFLNISKPSSITCFYCLEIGHASNSYFIQNQGTPKGEYMCVPKITH